MYIPASNKVTGKSRDESGGFRLFCAPTKFSTLPTVSICKSLRGFTRRPRYLLLRCNWKNAYSTLTSPRLKVHLTLKPREMIPDKNH